MKTCIILTGGKGTRLRPMTLKTPKPMLDVYGRPHLEHQVLLAKKHGFNHIIFSAGYLHESIYKHFGDGSDFGVEIEYALDGDNPLGTAGAIKNCESLIRSDNFLVMNGDILTDVSLSEVYESHLRSDSRITLTLVPVDDPTRFGVILTDENNLVTEFLEKPKDPPSNYINAGIYAMNTNVFHSIPRNTYYMVETDIFPQYAGLRLINAYKSDRYWLDIGTHETYMRAFYDSTLIGLIELEAPRNHPIVFNDDVWEGIMGYDFTLNNMLRLADAIAMLDLDHVGIMHDDRYMSEDFAELLKINIEQMIHIFSGKDGKFIGRQANVMDNLYGTTLFVGSTREEPYYNGVRILTSDENLQRIKQALR